LVAAFCKTKVNALSYPLLCCQDEGTPTPNEPQVRVLLCIYFYGCTNNKEFVHGDYSGCKQITLP